MQTGKMTLHQFADKLDFFRTMYDTVRLVDPISKTVLDSKGESLDEICYNYWQNSRICDNCISVRAYRSNKSFMKLEQTKNKILMVTALPIAVKGRALVIELLKDATDSMLIGLGDYNDSQPIFNVVRDLNHMVVIDHLTGCYNRLFLDDRLPVDIVKSTVDKTPLSVLFIDIDNMKVINDTLGHAAGDKALKYVVNCLRKYINREKHWVARYGGDEFFVCLNQTNQEEAEKMAEQMTAALKENVIRIDDREFSVTVSIGVVTVKEQQYNADELIHLADERMYEVKRKNKKAR